MLSGCIAPNAIQTKHWDHANTEGTAVKLWGYLKLPENGANWNAFFVWDTEKHDNYENYKYRQEVDSYDQWNFFSIELEELERTTEYHYRALGEHKTQTNEIRVGIDRTFIPGGPRVIVENPSDIGIDSAVLEGQLTHLGGADTCNVHFIYGTDPDNLNLETDKQTMTSTGDFNFELTGLTSCQKYYCQAVAQNDADTWVSNLPGFMRREFIPGQPITQTFLPTEVTETSAKFNGQLNGLGGTPTCEVWFEYGDENPNNLDEVSDIIILDKTEDYSIIEDDLLPATTYWVRAVADNGVCQSKGDIKEFRTVGGKDQIDQPNDSFDEINIPKTNFKVRISQLVEKLFSRFENLSNVLIQRVLENNPIIEKYLEEFGYR
jgi:hypothetical protein